VESQPLARAGRRHLGAEATSVDITIVVRLPRVKR
jgi:hypothetical protein